MEILVTIAYYFLVRLIFFDYKLIKWNVFWAFLVFGLYGAAVLTEVTMLGQYTPYSKEMVVESYLIQLAPEWGGIVKEVHAKPNVPLKKGDPVFSMDSANWQNKLDEAQAAYDLAEDTYKRLTAAGPSAVSQLQIDSARDHMREAEAEREEAQYNLDHATIYAPANGYCVNLQLRPGMFIRLKTPVVNFVTTDEYWIVATANQKAVQWIKSDNKCEIALDLYPGKVFPCEVERLVFATGQAQLKATGGVPTLSELKPSAYFALRLRRTGDWPDQPLRYGAKGLAAIYTDEAADVFVLLRKLEIRSESWLNYLYNPF